ncbi:DUF257 family protein [Thermococcus gorgonarius]|uniref:Uncharacterized protein n=1 Tax=Thermococcus gorgonarius TaxID=71997 RepID=A0A2Z2M499_THEGO|nr:DUF257 family protein [Thermococcus gorgonarius]ASI99995.1 hypothetical protein A3K92_00115 [Thermococcus gorgonarius]
MNGTLLEFFQKLKFGETVLIEYDPRSYPELFFGLIVKYAEESGLDTLVDDVLDTYPQFATKLRLMGVDLPEARVIKIGGGRFTEGTVVGKLEVDKYSAPLGHYSRVRDMAIGGTGNHINPVVGIHKLAYVLNQRETLSLLTSLSSFVGDQSRIALYLVNKTVLDHLNPGFLREFEEIATTLAMLDLEGENLSLQVIKAANPELMRKKYSMGVMDIIDWLRD